ncbi:ankyrin repeats (3 copies) domain-containing protein, partial [Fusarium austroafricanum]
MLQDWATSTAAEHSSREDAADAGFKDCLILLLQSGQVDPNQRDIEGRNLVHWAATLDCVDAMKLVSEMPGVKMDQRDRYGKSPIDIAFICQSKYVGLFLARKMPNINIYSWDLMYDTPESGYEIEDYQVDTCYEDDLLERNGQRQKLSNEEHEELQKQYPPDQWALVIPPP